MWAIECASVNTCEHLDIWNWTTLNTSLTHRTYTTSLEMHRIKCWMKTSSLTMQGAQFGIEHVVSKRVCRHGTKIIQKIVQRGRVLYKDSVRTNSALPCANWQQVSCASWESSPMVPTLFAAGGHRDSSTDITFSLQIKSGEDLSILTLPQSISRKRVIIASQAEIL